VTGDGARGARRPDGADAGRVTLDEVARRAGVSRAAASLAVRGRPGVGEDTRQRVVEVAGRLGYHGRPAPAPPAATGTVGLLVKGRPADDGHANAFYAPVIEGISRACADAGMDLRLDTLPVDDRQVPLATPRMLRAGDVDGLIVLGARLPMAVAERLASMPAVLVDAYVDGRPEGVPPLPSVLSDNAGGAAAVTRYLAGLGHRRIALVGSEPGSFPSIRDRRGGYAAAMADAGLAPLFVDGPHDDPLRCVGPVARLLARPDRPTAVVAANDAVALTLLSHLGIDVPGELSLAGFDDIEAGGLVRPRLTTVSVDKPSMGRTAVTLLRQRIAHPGDPSFTHVQHARVLVRESTAAPSGPDDRA